MIGFCCNNISDVLKFNVARHEKLNNKTINKLFNKKMQIHVVKNNVFLSMHYLMLTILFDHFLSVYTCEMFGVHRNDPRALQICVNLTRELFLD